MHTSALKAHLRVLIKNLEAPVFGSHEYGQLDYYTDLLDFLEKDRVAAANPMYAAYNRHSNIMSDWLRKAHPEYCKGVDAGLTEVRECLHATQWFTPIAQKHD